jgi:hypothetical protein
MECSNSEEAVMNSINKLTIAVVITLTTACATINSNTYYSYRITSDTVYALSPQYNAIHKIEKIIGADKTSFMDLGEGYATDINHAYFRGHIIIDADPNSLKVIEDTYASDSDHVYLEGRKIVGAEPLTFKMIKTKRGTFFNHYPYAQDNDKIYYQGKNIGACDYSSFKPAENIYKDWAEDKICIYAKGNKLPLESKASFNFIGNGYWHDDVKGYYREKELENADTKSLKIFRRFHATDGVNCYRYGKNESCLEFGKNKKSIGKMLDELKKLQDGTSTSITKKLPDLRLKAKSEITKKIDALILKHAKTKTFLTPDKAKQLEWSKPPEKPYQYTFRKLTTKVDIGLYSLIWHGSNTNEADVIYVGKVGKGRYEFSKNGSVMESPSEKTLDPKFNVRYTNGKCQFKIGECSYKIITAYDTEETIFVSTKYKAGVWTVVSDEGTTIQIIYDIKGLPIASFTTSDTLIELVEKTEY